MLTILFVVSLSVVTVLQCLVCVFLFLHNSIILFVQILVCYLVMVIILFCTLFSFMRSNLASQTRLILSHFYTTYRFMKCG